MEVVRKLISGYKLISGSAASIEIKKYVFLYLDGGIIVVTPSANLTESVGISVDFVIIYKLLAFCNTNGISMR